MEAILISSLSLSVLLFSKRDEIKFFCKDSIPFNYHIKGVAVVYLAMKMLKMLFVKVISLTISLPQKQMVQDCWVPGVLKVTKYAVIKGGNNYSTY